MKHLSDFLPECMYTTSKTGTTIMMVVTTFVCIATEKSHAKLNFLNPIYIRCVLCDQILSGKEIERIKVLTIFDNSHCHLTKTV